MANHNWKIGQDIVCIKTHSNGVVMEGEIYTIKALKEGFCRCGLIVIHIGKFSKGMYDICPDCKATARATDDILWLWDGLFAPLDTLTDISEIEAILSQPIETLYQI